MPSGETLRFTLVCKLPLLHFSRSRVAVVQRLNSLLSNRVCSLSLVRPSEDALSSRPCSRFPSSSAPAFPRARPLAWMPRSVRVTVCRLTVSAVSQFEYVLSTVPFSFSSGLWAILRSVRNPSTLFTLAFATRTASVKLRILRLLIPKFPTSSCWSASAVISYSFRRTGGELLPPSISRETPIGRGPVLTYRVRVRLRISSLVSEITLCSFFTIHRLPEASFSALLRGSCVPRPVI